MTARYNRGKYSFPEGYINFTRLALLISHLSKYHGKCETFFPLDVDSHDEPRVIFKRRVRTEVRTKASDIAIFEVVFYNLFPLSEIRVDTRVTILILR